MASIFKSLQDSELIQDYSDEEALKALRAGDSFYVGFDPTAQSLQIGNLVPLIVSVKLARAGLKPVILFGGATGAIGDPSGRNAERQLLSLDVIDQNISRQKDQISKLFETVGVTPTFVNNRDWTAPVDILSFLRDVGKFFTVNYMISKEVVKTRLNGEGISFTEFSYMLLQAFDFYHLYTNNSVRMQIGGSDQWGNITAGLELIRKKVGENTAVAFSIPLLTNSEGQKFGKTAGGAIWLDPTLTSPYLFHQFWLNTSDADVVRFMRIFTFLSEEEIQQYADLIKNTPEKREAQKTLADLITELVHGKDAVSLAKKSAQVLFGGSIEGLSDQELINIFQDVPSENISAESIKGKSILDLLVASKAVASKGEAKRLITGGGISINGDKVTNEASVVDSLLHRTIAVIRVGKKNYTLVKFS
jgi:tyrosyl-tRNA synthetase